MSTGAGTGAATAQLPETQTGTKPAETPKEDTDPREAALGDKGTELLREMRQTIKDQAAALKDLNTWKAEQDGAVTTAATEAERERETARQAELTAFQRLEEQLAAEKAERENFQRQYQERVTRDDFLQKARQAGVRDGSESDLYDLVKSEALKNGADLDSIIATQKERRPIFFQEKQGTKGHGGAAGTGDGGSGGPALNADEARFARLLGVKAEDYDKSKTK